MGAGRRLMAVWCFCTMAMTADIRAADSQAAARASVSPGQIVWSAQATEEKWALWISGPGFTMQTVFERGEKPYLTPIAPDGEQLQDGVYNWEMRALRGPSDEGEVEESEEGASGQSSETHIRRFERREAPVASGAFRVLRGAFVRPRERR